MSVRPVVAGMRLGGRSPEARTGCGMHIRHGVEGVGGRGRTAFSVLGTMVDLVQCLYHSHMALMGKVHRWAVGSLRVVVVVGVRNGSREMLRLACSFPSINKHSSCRFPKEEFVYSQSETLIPSGIQSSHAKTAIP
jgi:hypothetical protein